jgi:hypothetical protein
MGKLIQQIGRRLPISNTSALSFLGKRKAAAGAGTPAAAPGT